MPNNVNNEKVKEEAVKELSVYVTGSSVYINGSSNHVKESSIKESSAYSTVFDALFLLVLISLSGVLLMPSLQADEQYVAAGYVTSSEMDTYLLESLLSCKLEDFEYEISPLSVLNVSVPENSVVESPAHTLFGKEQKHRTFADLTADYLAISLSLSKNGSAVSLNPLAEDYSAQASEAIAIYLDRKIAGRFSYRFEAYWYPVEAFPLGSELIVGDKPPANAIRQSTKLSMPLYASAPSRGSLLACVNDSVLEASLNVSEEEASRELFRAFNASLDAAALEGAETVVGLIFPSDYSGSVFGEEADESFETLLYGVSENAGEANSSSTEDEFNAYLSTLLESGFAPDSEPYPENYSENVSAAELSLLEDLLADHIRTEIRAELEAEFSGEINETVHSIIEVEDLSEAQALRDARIEEIYRQVNPGGARIVLYLWKPF
ncbi:DUF7284 family protein [Methanosarcina acetivorans]|uniref:Uncharacterized protein n=1 Tax=Methanosarcina acetivorans (strain ATCC 35395 / DSM 2834 / JCM 12185 / C2A) TaxID=188937 RepID=Q8TS57_METAC|nr:hypothetical protein [Methanosarcina acetivorans]AAM04381.1 predicted protein [Methanosarcina acetivorans C2A]